MNHRTRKEEAMKIPELIGEARSQLSSLTGLPLGTTTGVSKADEGWKIAVELVEKKSIPDGMDILATYEVRVDPKGNLLEFHRKGMRKRIDIEQTDQESEEI